jgi:hypothetical protein
MSGQESGGVWHKQACIALKNKNLINRYKKVVISLNFENEVLLSDPVVVYFFFRSSPGSAPQAG